MKRGTALMVLVSVLGLLITTGCAWISGKRVNPVAQAGLRDTVEIEVVELNTWDPGDEPYVHRLSITDASVIEGLLNALDTALRVTLKVQCIPEYELRFHLRDGALETFGYSCSGATFIRGEQDFWGDEDYRPPEEFDALLQEQLAATVPSEVNVAVEAGLSETVRIEVFETVTEAVHAEEAGKPAVVQAQVVHRLTLTDPDSRRGRPGMEEETAVKPTRSLRYLARQMLLIGCALLMAGCAGVEEAPAADLAGTRWALTSLDGDGLIEGTEITLTFEEAFLGGKMTCNGYGGTPDGGKVTVRRTAAFASSCWL
jgi:hypothetical protein